MKSFPVLSALQVSELPSDVTSVVIFKGDQPVTDISTKKLIWILGRINFPAFALPQSNQRSDTRAILACFHAVSTLMAKWYLSYSFCTLCTVHLGSLSS